MSTAYPELSGNKDLLPAQVEFEKRERAKRLASKDAMKSINDNLKQPVEIHRLPLSLKISARFNRQSTQD